MAASPETTLAGDLVRDLLEQLWEGSREPARSAIAQNALVTAPDGPAQPGPEGAREALRTLRTAFPAGTASVADVVADDELAIARLELEGAHEGDLFGIPPTGQSTSVLAIVVASVADGRLTSFQVEYDVMGLFERLRILPPIETVPYPAIWAMSRSGRFRRGRREQDEPETAEEPSRDGNVALVRSVLEEVFNRRNLDAADAYLAEDVLIHHPVYPGPVIGLDAFKDLPRKLFEGFPDLRVTPEHTVAEGDRVGARWLIRGIHDGRYRRVPATRRHVTIPVHEIVHIRDGRIAEMWFAINLFGVAQQLGVMPSLATIARLRRMRPRRRATVAMPPGPRGNPVLGNILDFKRDMVDAVVRGWETHGDVVSFRGRAALFPVYLFVHPDHVQHVLADNGANYAHPDSMRAKFARVVGNSLVTKEGAVWEERRHRAQPALARDRVAASARVMIDHTAAMLDDWERRAARGEAVEIQSEFMHLVLGILTTSLFGADLSADAEPIERSVHYQTKFLNDSLNAPFDLPDWAPLPSVRRFARERATFDAIVDRLVATRRAEGAKGDDLLSTLLQARDAETGREIDAVEARDEVKAFILAGHETTAISLAWTCWLLTQHPEAERRVRAQVEDVLDGSPPEPGAVWGLTESGRAIKESLRLYPPLWFLIRTPLEDDEVAGYRVPAGTTVAVCPFATHRHPEFWPNPESFDLDRFTPEREAERHKFAWFPFAGGPRSCMGAGFALLEMHIVLAMIMQRFRFRLVPGHPVIRESAVSLRQQHGALMMLEPA